MRTYVQIAVLTSMYLLSLPTWALTSLQDEPADFVEGYRIATGIDALNEAAHDGYRPVGPLGLVDATRLESAYLMEKRGVTGTIPVFNFLRWRGDGKRIHELLQQVTEEGYRYVPKSLTDMDCEVQGLFKIDRDSTRYEYKILATERHGTLEREMHAALADGWTVREMYHLHKPSSDEDECQNPNGALLEKVIGPTEIESSSGSRPTPGDENEESRFVAGMDALNDAARGGYRLLGIADAYQGSWFRFLVVKREETKPVPEYRFYRWSEDGDKAHETLQEAAQVGYRLIPNTFRDDCPSLGGVFEKLVGRTRYEYKAISALRHRTFAKELYQALSEGWVFHAGSKGWGRYSCSGGTENLHAILERELSEGKEGVGSAQLSTAGKYLDFATFRIATFRKELDAAAARGYRIMVMNASAGYQAVMVRSESTQFDSAAYRVISWSSNEQITGEMNRSAAEGYRYSKLLKSELIVMERDPDRTVTYEYRYISAKLFSTVKEEFWAAINEGFVPVQVDPRSIILERAT